PRGPGDRPDPEYREVSPGYFRTLHTPVLKGREFAEQDDAQHPPVAIISQSLALKYWGTEDPLGRRIRFSEEPGTKWITIVGVVGDVKQTALSDPVLPTLYLPHLQSGFGFGSMMTVLARAAVDALAAAGLALGILGSVVLARTISALSSLLHGVTATDPLTLAAVLLLLLGVAVVACWVPARKATRVDPTVALRGE